MAVCVPFPDRPTTGVLFYATNVVLTPLIFGLGILGNLLVILVLNRHYLRKANAVYVYLTGVAVVDILSLLALIPSGLRDIEVLPVNVTYSMPMSYAAWFCRGGQHVFNTASAWLLVFVTIVAYMTTRWPSSPRRFMRISSSRIGVFVIFMFCAMANFPRFFERISEPVTGHCFVGQELWAESSTSFGQGALYRAVYPWLSAALCHILPYSLLLIFACLLAHYAGCSNLAPTAVCRSSFTKPKRSERPELQLARSVFVIVCAFLLLELPSTVLYTVRAALGPALDDVTLMQHEFPLVARCLGLVHCALNFIFLSAFNYDFRKAFSRTCCCLCLCCIDDDDEDEDDDDDDDIVKNKYELEDIKVTKKTKGKSSNSSTKLRSDVLPEIRYVTPQMNGYTTRALPEPTRGPPDHTRLPPLPPPTQHGYGDVVREMRDGWI